MISGEGNVAFNATPNPFLLNKLCLNQIIVLQAKMMADFDTGKKS